VVHRDIKPSNVLITSQGRAKLVDMGLARLRQVERSGDDLTASGVTLGTFDYISPEQARDPRTADVRSDIYSLGCTLYFMLTGRPPFPDGTVLQKLLRHQGDEPPDPLQFNPHLSEGICVIIRKMLAKDPRRRHQHPTELLGELLVLADELGWQTQGAGSLVWLAPKSNRWSLILEHVPWAVPLAALVAIVAFLEFVVWRDAGQEVAGAARSPIDARLAQSTFDGLDAAGGPSPSIDHWPAVAGDEPLVDATAIDGSPASRAATAGTARPGTEVTDASAQPVQPAEGGPSTAGPGRSTGSAGSSEREGAEGPSAVSDEGASDDVAADGDADRDTGDDGAGDSSDSPPADDPSEGPRIGSIPTDQGADAVTAEPGPTVGTSPTGVSPGDAAPGDPAESGADEEDVAEAPSISPAPPPVSPVAQPQVLIVDPLGTGGPSERSLKEALLKAKNGDVIELRFSGPLEERPIRLDNLRVTVRGGESFRPVIVFRPNEVDPLKYPRSMVHVVGGQLTLVNVALELDVPRHIPAARWTLVEAQQAELVRMERSSLTIRNATDSRAAFHPDVTFIDVSAAPGPSMMMDDDSPPPRPVMVQLQHCVARGEALFLRSDDGQPLTFLWENGLLTTTERFYAASAGAMPPRHRRESRIELRHVTAVARAGLVQISGGDDARHPLATEFYCKDSILMSDAGSALVQHVGVDPAGGFRNSFRWNGERNFYEGLQVFWRILPLGAQGGPQDWPLTRWQAYWTPTREISPSWGLVGWKLLPNAARPLNSHTPADYALDVRTPDNHAKGAASDGRDVGLESADLPPVGP
jgi:serine/threonine-protein kinase